MLESWCNFLLRRRPTHLSLHFDGVRVDEHTVGDVEGLISASESKVKESTGFIVKIRQKTHNYFMQALRALDSVLVDGVPPELRKAPNCIPCALWHLASADDKETCLQAFINLEAVQNSYAAERKYRTYRQCAELLQVQMIPTVGACDKPGHYLLHSENNGSPHCVSLRVLELEEAESLSVVVTDEARQYKLTAAAFADLALNSTDSSTMVSFRVSPREGEETSSCLLDLQAGSSAPSSEEESTLFEQPNFIDSEFSTPRSSMGSAIPAFMLFPELIKIKERVSLLEGLCCDYVPLLASQPSLWNKIPSTGAALSQTEWLAEICEARRQLHTAWSSTSSTFPAPADEAVCRVDKRLKVYMSMLRVHRDTPGAVDVVGLGGAGNVLPAKNSANAGCRMHEEGLPQMKKFACQKTLLWWMMMEGWSLRILYWILWKRRLQNTWRRFVSTTFGRSTAGSSAPSAPSDPSAVCGSCETMSRSTTAEKRSLCAQARSR